MAAQIYIFTNSVQVIPFLLIQTAFVICGVFDDSHSDKCEVVYYCGFDLHFCDNRWHWISFHVLCWPSVCILYVFWFNFVNGNWFLYFFSSWFNLGRLYIYWICPFYCHIIAHSNLLIILCISMVSVVISPFPILTFLIWSSCFLNESS